MKAVDAVRELLATVSMLRAFHKIERTGIQLVSFSPALVGICRDAGPVDAGKDCTWGSLAGPSVRLWFGPWTNLSNQLFGVPYLVKQRGLPSHIVPVMEHAFMYPSILALFQSPSSASSFSPPSPRSFRPPLDTCRLSSPRS